MALNKDRTDLEFEKFAEATSATGTYAVRVVNPDGSSVTNGSAANLTSGAFTKKYYTNSGAVTDGIIWSPAAGKRWYITDMIINVSADAAVTLEDDQVSGDSVVAKFELAANSGVAHRFETPLFSGESGADLLITTTAGNVYVCLTGYEV